MTSIVIDNFTVDIAIHSIDGILQKTLHLPFRKGFWVLLTVVNETGEKESFPLVDDDFKIKIFGDYSEALQEMAERLNKFLS
jgi:hypothetical protein